MFRQLYLSPVDFQGLLPRSPGCAQNVAIHLDRYLLHRLLERKEIRSVAAFELHSAGWARRRGLSDQSISTFNRNSRCMD